MSPTDDPTEGQTLKDIETCLRGLETDDEVAIRNTHGGILTFQIARVIGIKPKSGRRYTDRSGYSGGAAWYMKSGKTTFHPIGQARLFVPTQEVRSFVKDHPTGVMTYNTHTPE